MKRRTRLGWLNGGWALPVVAVVWLAALAGCSSSKAAPTPTCVYNSQCDAHLVCALGFCVKACETSTDCPTNERCIVVASGGADGGGQAGAGGSSPDASSPDGAASLDASTTSSTVATACQAPESVGCQYNSECKLPLVCGIDQQCRNQCKTDEDCPGGTGTNPTEVCTSMSHLCVDPSIDTDYDPATKEFRPKDAGAGGGSDSGAGGKGGKGGGGGGSGVPACANPQTSFPNVAQGDSNPNFTSAVAVRNADTLFIFSSYAGPVTAADGGSAGADAAVTNGNRIYVQAFDPATGNKRGAATSLYAVPDGLSFGVYDVAIAPTGEIVLLYALGTPSNGIPVALYALFLDVSTSQDGGGSKLQAVKSVLLESVNVSRPHVTWSAAGQEFILSWKYYTTDWYTRIRRFFPSGAAAGDDTSIVPTETGDNSGGNYDDSQVGTSGTLLGVGIRNVSNGNPTLTLLGPDGLQVGGFLNLANLNIGGLTVGGTTKGFAALSFSGSTATGTFVPVTGAASVLDGGMQTSADASAVPTFKTFTFPSNGTMSKSVNDDTGGQGGAGIVILESNGANFLYVSADGSKQYKTGTVLSSNTGTWISLANYRGSFAISIFSSGDHSAQAAASGCSP